MSGYPTFDEALNRAQQLAFRGIDRAIVGSIPPLAQWTVVSLGDAEDLADRGFPVLYCTTAVLAIRACDENPGLKVPLVLKLARDIESKLACDGVSDLSDDGLRRALSGVVAPTLVTNAAIAMRRWGMLS